MADVDGLTHILTVLNLFLDSVQFAPIRYIFEIKQVNLLPV